MTASSQILVSEDNFGRLGMDIDSLLEIILEIVQGTPPQLVVDGPLPDLLSKVNHIGRSYRQCLPDVPHSGPRSTDNNFTVDPELPCPLNVLIGHG